MSGGTLGKMRVIACTGLAFLFGCGQTQFVERHSFQAKDDQGNKAYYRMTITGDAALAKTHYRAGVYNSEAVDSVLGEVGTKPINSNNVADDRAEDPKNSYDPSKTSKFIIIFSVNASMIEELIANFLEESETANAIVAGLAAIAGPSRIEGKIAAEEANAKLQPLIDARKRLEAIKKPTTVPPTDAEKKKFADDVRSALTEISAFAAH